MLQICLIISCISVVILSVLGGFIGYFCYFCNKEYREAAKRHEDFMKKIEQML